MSSSIENYYTSLKKDNQFKNNILNSSITPLKECNKNYFISNKELLLSNIDMKYLIYFTLITPSIDIFKIIFSQDLVNQVKPKNQLEFLELKLLEVSLNNDNKDIFKYLLSYFFNNNSVDIRNLSSIMEFELNEKNHYIFYYFLKDNGLLNTILNNDEKTYINSSFTYQFINKIHNLHKFETF